MSAARKYAPGDKVWVRFLGRYRRGRVVAAISDYTYLVRSGAGIWREPDAALVPRKGWRR